MRFCSDLGSPRGPNDVHAGKGGFELLKFTVFFLSSMRLGYGGGCKIKWKKGL